MDIIYADVDDLQYREAVDIQNVAFQELKKDIIHKDISEPILIIGCRVVDGDKRLKIARMLGYKYIRCMRTVQEEVVRRDGSVSKLICGREKAKFDIGDIVTHKYKSDLYGIGSIVWDGWSFMYGIDYDEYDGWCYCEAKNLKLVKGKGK